jgi:putative membrane protein
MKEHLAVFLKGFAMGAANVVPGVSGGTIALITGIYERLIEALKSFDLEAVKMALGFRIADLWRKIDGWFLTALGFGVVASIISLAKILKWGFESYPTIVGSIFFGLIAASIPSVGRMIKEWSAGVFALFLAGMAVAISMAFLTPASENSGIGYLLLCGVAAMCSMIIPGLSGSFVLYLMGNYFLIMIEPANSLSGGDLTGPLAILIPVGVGAVLGLLALARILGWLFKNHHDKALAVITGFVAGSLAIIWPWKDTVVVEFEVNGKIKEKIVGYENWRFPDFSTGEVWMQLGALIAGVLLILAVEVVARRKGVDAE